MSDTLEVKKDRVLAAAEKCPTAKATLVELFPEAFETKLPRVEMHGEVLWLALSTSEGISIADCEAWPLGERYCSCREFGGATAIPFTGSIHYKDGKFVKVERQ